MSAEPTTLTEVLDAHGPALLVGRSQCLCGVVIHDESQFRSHLSAELLTFLAAHFQKPEVVEAAASVLLRDYSSEYANNFTWHEFSEQATEVIAAALETLR